MKEITYILNGETITTHVDPRWSLFELLRGEVSSIKRGCDVGECGACTVLIDGKTYNSCIYLAVWANGKHIRTVESLSMPDGSPGELQKAFMDDGAVQCGFCTPGFLLSATALIEEDRTFTREEIRRQLSGNLCRCTGYENIINAVEKTINKHIDNRGTK